MKRENTASEILNMILSDPPERRWRSVRALSRVSDPSVRNAVLEDLQLKLDEGISDPMVSERVKLAFRMINAAEIEPPYNTTTDNNEISHITTCGNDDSESAELPFPVVDFHVHPKRCDSDMISDFSGIKLSFWLLIQILQT